MDLKTLAGFTVGIASWTPDGLFAHDADSIIAKGITLAAGSNLQRGTVLGVITSSGKYVAATASASDGSQTPTAVLAEDTDASAGDTKTIAYFEGTFVEGQLILGNAMTIGPVRTALRAVGIYTDIAIPGLAATPAPAPAPSPAPGPAPAPGPVLPSFPAYLGAVSGGVRFPDSTYSGAQYINARTPHFARGGTLTGLQVGWSSIFTNGTYNDTPSGYAETATASLEYPAGTFTQLKWSGASSVTVPNGYPYPLTDPCPVAVPDGALFWIRYNRAGAGPAGVYNQFAGGSGQYLIDNVNGSQMEVGSAPLTDKTMGGTIPAAVDSITYPFLVLGQTTKATPVILGDSRVIGPGDQIAGGSVYRGEIERSIGPVLGYIDLSRSGESAHAFLAGGSNRLYYTSLYGTHFIIEYGINDLAGGRTATQLIADLQSIRAGLPAGKPVFLTTLPPQTTSTNGFIDTANQAPTSHEAERVSYNTQVRAGISGFAGFFEIADPVESARNSGLWKPNSTIDGTHENHTAALAIQSSGAVDPTRFV